MKISHSDISSCTFLCHARLRAALVGAALCLALVNSPLAADQWIACDGTLVSKKGSEAPTTTQVTDVYSIDDAAKALFKYSDTRQRLDMISLKSFDAKSILWQNDGEGFGSQAAQWQGRIDRNKMSLSLVRRDGDETLTWTQACKPTDPRPLK